jgi:hypothetical protein
MNGKARRTAVLAILCLATALVTTGCSLPGCQSTPQGSQVRISQQAAQRVQVKVEQIVASPRPDFTFDVTDEEATSYLALSFNQTSITEPEVRFLDGKVQLSGKVAQLLSNPVVTVWTAQVADGTVRVKIVSATVACIPVPTQLLDSLSDTLNQMILESQVNIQVREIKVEAGRAQVSGQKTR